jgi:hypothetical protein
MLCLSYYAYVFSSTKSVTRAERDLPETEGGGDIGGGGQGGKITQCMHIKKKRFKKTPNILNTALRILNSGQNIAVNTEFK